MRSPKPPKVKPAPTPASPATTASLLNESQSPRLLVPAQQDSFTGTALNSNRNGGRASLLGGTN